MTKKTSFAILFIVLSVPLFSTNYYVSPSGNNANDGSLASPWLTVQHALNQLNSGDVLNLMNGTYNEKISIPISGIALKNHTGHSPILDGGSQSATAMISIENVSNITIDGLEIFNNVMNDAQGIQVDGNCQNITIQNCVIHGIHFSSNAGEVATPTKNAQGIIVYGSDQNNAITNLNILNNQLYDCRLGYSEGIAVNGNVDGFTISGNLVYDLTNIGIDAIGHEGTSMNAANDQARNGSINNNTVYNCVSTYATSGGIYVDGGQSIVIENNTSYHNGYGIEIGCENFGKTTSNITVRNNVFYDNEVAALALGGFDFPASTGKVINSTFRNNTCYFDDYGSDFIGEMFLSYFEGCTIENNIFYATNQNVAFYHEGTAPLSSSINYNLYYSNNLGSGIEFSYAGNSYAGLAELNLGTGFEANGIEINPQLANPAIAVPDFHLQSSSPAIDSGNPAFTPAGSEKDLDGASRKIGANVDCGVDEYAGALAVEYLQKLQARIKNNQVELSWSTVSEVNSDRFEIERSSDAKNWKKIGQIDAKNNSNTLVTYVVVDTEPFAGLSYYRLKQYDFDAGSYPYFSYSNIANIHFEKLEFTAYPNPVQKVLKVSFSKEMRGEIIVFDVLGNRVLQQVFQGNVALINMGQLMDGLYAVTIHGSTEIINVKVILQR